MRPRICLVRHGETAWTRAGRYQGRTDQPLDPVGAETARRLAPALATAGVALVLTSPLARAHRTALLAAPRGVRVVSDARLIELDFGAWEGLTEADAKARFPTAMRRWKQDPATARPPGGEALGEALARWHDFLANPPWTTAPISVAVVTHTAIIRLALLDAAGDGLARFRAIKVPPGSLHQLADLAPPAPSAAAP